MSQIDKVEQALRILNGQASLKHIYLIAIDLIGDHDSHDIKANIRRCLNSNPDKFYPIHGKGEAWWGLVDYKNEIEERDSRIANLEDKNQKLLKRIVILEKQIPVMRSFTLKQILNYIKKRCTEEGGKVLIAMVNFFLRDAKDVTEQEREAVDQAEQELLNRKHGDQVYGNKFSASEGGSNMVFGDGKSVEPDMLKALILQMDSEEKKRLLNGI